MNIEESIAAIAQMKCQHELAGIAIGVIVGDQQYQVIDGYADREKKTPLTADSLFEIGSITKVFCSLLLAKFAVNGRLDLDTPAADALPSGQSLPTDGKRQITFRNLANHRSSLPRLPSNLDATIDDQSNPYANYQVEDLYEYLGSVNSLKPIGDSEEYSNLGYGLLGHSLGQIAESNFSEALTQHVLAPLELRDTAIELTDEQSLRLATAHETFDKPTKHWEFSDATVAAGGIRSSLPDMLTFLKSNLHPDRSSLSEAIKLTHQPAPTKEKPNNLPWHLLLATALSGLSVGIQWAFGIGPPGFVFLILVLFPPLLMGCFGKLIPSLVAVGLTTLFTRLLWGPGFGWASALFVGMLVACSISEIFRLASIKYPDDGMLGWQSTPFENQKLIWHNGQVGGAAGFIGFIQELDIGVVVLTNTDKNVDEIGTDVLEKLANVESSHGADYT